MAVPPIPHDYHSITPYLMINGAVQAIEFYRRAFGATESFRLEAPGGKVGHAEIQIGDSRIMMADDCGGESPFRNPTSMERLAGGSSPVRGRCGQRLCSGYQRGRHGDQTVQDQFLRG
jgi:PhnB protein